MNHTKKFHCDVSVKEYNKYLPTHVHSTTIHNGQTMESAQVPTNQWMNKENIVYIQWDIIQS
jgi:hypothetical protein